MKPFYENKRDDFYCRDSDYKSKSLAYTSHLHYHIELAFLMGGRTRVTVDSNVYDVEAGDVIIVFPNQIHRFETLEKEKFILMIVNPDIISEFTKQFTSSIPESNIIKGGALDEDLSLLAKKISDSYYGNEQYKDTILRGYLLSFFGKILQKLTVKDVQAKEYNVLGSILNYCINNSSKPLSLDILEKELHISKYYISHIMSNKLRMGFNDYINSLRVSNACKYLQKSDKSITEISDIVGFNTLRTFNRAFLKQMGITPSEYRAKK
ncbi:MAG: AraC family transcriptional regulator [Clostridia bacterium]|nr:AraC family transcriptional regulator [Clostridia bacterium]